MRKILVALILSVFSVSTASAEIGVNIGVSGQLGLFAASATETDTGIHGTTTTGDNEKNSDSDYIGLGYASIFIEKELGPIAIGIDYVPSPLATETSETIVDDKTLSATSSKVTNKVQVDFDDLTTLYVALNLGDTGAYVKAGYISVDIITNEKLGTGSTYKNTDTSGHSLGLGYNKDFGNGMFIRAEGNYMEFDGVAVTSSSGSQKISMDSLDGVAGKLSVGKSF
tara:strand:+ start:1422 stop:2099 length:678 start_codon:yes stop_codon:yes gene_type:complete